MELELVGKGKTDDLSLIIKVNNYNGVYDMFIRTDIDKRIVQKAVLALHEAFFEHLGIIAKLRNFPPKQKN